MLQACLNVLIKSIYVTGVSKCFNKSIYVTGVSKCFNKLYVIVISLLDNVLL